MSDASAPRRLPGIGGVFTVLDGTALVTGAAVSSVHVRNVIDDYASLAAIGTLPVWLTFLWLSITSAGPFLFVLRRYGARHPDYPRLGDTLWLLFGLPWLLSALLRSIAPSGRSSIPAGHLLWLTIGLGVASAAGVVSLARSSALRGSGSDRAERASATWTDIVGWTICVAWPIQFGMLLVVSTSD